VGPGDQLVFPSSERFDVVGELGRGGMGVVYEVRDRDRQVRLALKGVKQLRSKELLRLKTEFRAARDLVHPNLVRLGELFEQDGACYFTMELVAGVHLLRWLRPVVPGDEPEPPPPEPLDLSGETRTAVEPLGGYSRNDRTEFASVLSGSPDEGRRSKHGPLIADRLRAAFRGLVTGVAVLHRAGLIHRDIKPSNVLVEESGRVVLLDFGVVTAVDAEVSETHREIVGTYAYMAPEQATGQDVGPAADWYAVGVVLFEALTGRLPFAPGRGALHAKIAVPAPAVRALTPDAPADLAALCERLLRRDPSTRPLEKEILAAFGIEADHLSDSGDGSMPSGPFIGRGDELAALLATFEHAARQGAAACAFVTGESGIGKSVLVKQLLGTLRERRADLLVLHGRCDEREIVPYNAFDGVVDGLARHLGGVPTDELRLPTGVGALVRLFPVLRGVEGIARAADQELVALSPWTDPTTPSPNADPAKAGSPDLRSAAFAALGEVLAFVASRRHVVLSVDDVHWADLDSLALLAEIMSGPEAPPVFLVATARQVPGAPPCPAIAVVKTTSKVVALHGLDAVDAERLLRALAPDAALDGARTAALIAETRGHPLFLAEMMRRHAGSGPAHGLLLDDALWQRTSELAEGARGLLEIVALASTSLELGTAAEAANLPPERFSGHLAELRAARLVRLSGTRDRDAIEPYHDRVREAVAARTPAPRRAEVHRTLAIALEHRGGGAEVLAYHFAAAGERARAAGFAEAAARRALASLAFDRAAAWLRSAIDLGEHTAERRRVLLGELGETLARAGRTAESARAFLEASAAAPDRPEDARELRRRAAEQFLTGGHLEDGLATARVALREVGLSLPEGAVSSASRLGWFRVRLGSSRLRWRPRDPDKISARDRMRIDLCWSVGCGLSMVDSVRGAVFALHGPLLAMRAGDPTRIARAHAAAVVAAAGMGLERLARRLLASARVAASHTEDPLAAFYADLAAVFPHFYLDNDWRATASSSEAAAARWGTTGRGHAFELDVVEQHHLWSLQLLGEIAELRRRVPATIRASQRIGNRFVEVLMRTWFPIIGLSRDDPEGARADVADAFASWRPASDRVDNPFYFSVRARTMIALYQDVASMDPAALDALDADWARIRRSLFAYLPVVAVELHTWSGMLSCARARANPAAAKLHLANATRSLARLGKQTLPVTVAFVAQLGIAVAAARGDLDGARVLLEAAIPDLDARGMRATAAAARWRLGPLLGGDAGARTSREAERYFEAEGVVRPDRLIETAFPGWPAALRLNA